MTDREKKITAWISIAIILFGMASGAIAFTVTTNNKADNNERRIDKVEVVSNNNKEKINTAISEVKRISKIEDKLEKMTEQNTQILVAIGELKTQLENK